MLEPKTYLQDESGHIVLYQHWLSDSHSNDLLSILTKEPIWNNRDITLFGKTHPIPRLENWQGEDGIRYGYSGQEYTAAGWNPALLSTIEQMEKAFCWRPNSALLNMYRNGEDSMGWHSDNELALGANPTVAILSLGETRDLLFRQSKNPKNKIKVSLDHGSLLLMTGCVQNYWQHALPRRVNKGLRISCTFRAVI